MNGKRNFPEINGVMHSWANLQVTITGRAVVGITKIEYNDKQTIVNVYGAGQRPIGRGYGNIECDAKITLLRDEVEAIRSSSDTGRLQDIAPFDIIVQFIREGEVKMVTHKLRKVQFMEDSLSISQGDTSNSVELPLIVSHIDFK